MHTGRQEERAQDKQQEGRNPIALKAPELEATLCFRPFPPRPAAPRPTHVDNVHDALLGVYPDDVAVLDLHGTACATGAAGTAECITIRAGMIWGLLAAAAATAVWRGMTAKPVENLFLQHSSGAGWGWGFEAGCTARCGPGIARSAEGPPHSQAATGSQQGPKAPAPGGDRPKVKSEGLPPPPPPRWGETPPPFCLPYSAPQARIVLASLLRRPPP